MAIQSPDFEDMPDMPELPDYMLVPGPEDQEPKPPKEFELKLAGKTSTRAEDSTDKTNSADDDDLLASGKGRINLDAGRGIEKLVTQWLQHHRVTYSVSTNSFRWMNRDYSQKELVDQVHLSLVYQGDRIKTKLLAAALKQIAVAKREQAIQGLVQQLCRAPRTTDAELRAWMREMLVAGISEEEYENCVTVLKHWLWLVQRQLLGLRQDWHIMPIFWGAQGGGKSTQVQNLLKPLGSFQKEETFRIFIDQFAALPMHWSYVLFLDEMASAEKAEATAIKRAISSPEIPGRGMYSDDGRRLVRNASFIACTNRAPTHGLEDSTGGRRFYSLPCRATPVTGARREFFSTVNYMNLWCCVDPQGPAPLDARRDQISARQNEVNRARSIYEDFIADCLDKAEDDERMPIAEFKRRISDYVTLSKKKNEIPSGAKLRIELEALGYRCTNTGNTLRVHGLVAKENDDPAVAEFEAAVKEDAE